MKKRFTIMLDEEIIARIKRLNLYYTPTAIRQFLQLTLEHDVNRLLDELGDNNEK